MRAALKGIPFTEEHKEKLTIARRKMFENSTEEERKRMNKSKKGLKLNEEHKSKIGDGVKQFFENLSDERREEIRLNKAAANKLRRKPWTDEERAKAVERAKLIEKVECPHCGKTFKPGFGNRWHFDNCKLKGDK